MKLKIKNFWKFNDYATFFFRDHEKKMVDCYGIGSKYFFKFQFQNIEWKIELHTETDFMPGWPVEVWAYDYSLGAIRRLSETNVKHDILNDKDRWCRFLDDLITTNYIHNRKILTR